MRNYFELELKLAIFKQLKFLFIILRMFNESLDDKSTLASYVLMERIQAVDHINYIIRPNKTLIKERVITELGLFGVYIG